MKRYASSLFFAFSSILFGAYISAHLIFATDPEYIVQEEYSAFDRQGKSYFLTHEIEKNSQSAWRLVYRRVFNNTELERIILKTGANINEFGAYSEGIIATENGNVWLSYRLCKHQNEQHFCERQIVNVLPNDSKINRVIQDKNADSIYGNSFGEFKANKEQVVAFFYRYLDSSNFYLNLNEADFKPHEIKNPYNVEGARKIFELDSDGNIYVVSIILGDSTSKCARDGDCRIGITSFVSQSQQTLSTHVSVPSNTFMSEVVMTPYDALMFVTANKSLQMHTKPKASNEIDTKLLQSNFWDNLLRNHLKNSTSHPINLNLIPIKNKQFLLIEDGFEATIANLTQLPYSSTAIIPRKISQLLIADTDILVQPPTQMAAREFVGLNDYWINADNQIVLKLTWWAEVDYLNAISPTIKTIQGFGLPTFRINPSVPAPVFPAFVKHGELYYTEDGKILNDPIANRQLSYKHYLPVVAGENKMTCDTYLRDYWHQNRQDRMSVATIEGYLDAANMQYQALGAFACLMQTRLPGTVPLDLYYHVGTNDNFVTATPEGVNDAVYAGYQRIRTEGYIFKEKHKDTIALKTYWNPTLKDNWSVVEGYEAFAESLGYRFIRVEGYVCRASFASTCN
ncbi:MAG: hypothetical protein KIH69_014165 [Anaerolineae bacterium]|nr:hypothetical protein [Anaerolineae bacterium]